MAFRSERKNDKSGGFQEETRKFFSPEYFFSDKKIAFEKECTYLGIEFFHQERFFQCNGIMR